MRIIASILILTLTLFATGAPMKMRNLLLSIALLFSGVVRANQESQVYKQEFAEVKESPDLKNLFDKDVYVMPHNLERQIQNFAAIPNRCHRLACFFFLNHDVLVATQKNMPKLCTFVDALAKKADIQTPYIFISMSEGAVNAVAAKLLKGIGGILIDQKALNEFTDKQLEAVIAHEMGHIKFEHINKNLAIIVPAFFASLYLSHKAMCFAKSKLPNNKICNWGYWLGGYLRYVGLHEYSLGLLSASIMAYVSKSLIIGKKFEQQADSFAYEMGYAQDLIEGMHFFEQQNQKIDLQLVAANDKLTAEQANLTPEDFNELQQGIQVSKMIVSFLRWVQAKTPFIPHPSNADRITAAQAYLDAQVPAIEKA